MCHARCACLYPGLRVTEGPMVSAPVGRPQASAWSLVGRNPLGVSGLAWTALRCPSAATVPRGILGLGAGPPVASGQSMASEKAMPARPGSGWSRPGVSPPSSRQPSMVGRGPESSVGPFPHGSSQTPTQRCNGGVWEALRCHGGSAAVRQSCCQSQELLCELGQVTSPL